MRHLSPRLLVAVALAVAIPIAALAQPADKTGGAAGSAAASGSGSGTDDNTAPLYNCSKAKGQVSANFKPDIELKDLLTWAMSFTCKNFIYDQGVLSRSKKLTIIAPVKMSADEAYKVFLVGLETMGLTVVSKGNVLKVVESGQAKGETVAIKHGTPASSEEFVRVILRPSNLAAQDLSDALTALKSADGDIKVVGKAGVVLVSDYASHVKDMITLTREIDKPSQGANVYTIKVVYADAKSIADMVNQLLQSANAAAGAATGPQAGKGGRATEADIESAVPTKLLSDDRTNTLILLSNEAGYLRVRALVKRLDVPLESESTGSIHVYRLENAKAEDLAQTLNSALTGMTQAGQSATGGGNRRPVPTQAPVPQSTGGNAVDGATFEGQVHVTSDAPTNSLVVISSGRDFLALRPVIQALDAPRRQVFIEAVILELQSDTDLDLGTSFHGGVPTSDGGIGLFGLQHANLKSIDPTSLATQTGLVGAVLGPLLNEAAPFLGVSIPSYGVLFQALAKNRNVNVLSSPHILTTDNVEAEISVGQNIPYLGAVTFAGLGAAGGAAGGLSGFGQQSIQRQDIALDMKITPHVNNAGKVRLDIEQDIQDVGDKDPQLGPTWTKRKIKTTVVVADQQSIVIGGLMSDRVTYSESKIPILGDIPILGYLFKYTEKSKQKTNLLVLLTPYIIEDQTDIDRIVERKVRERSEFLRSFSDLEEAAYLPELDYRKKRGLIEEINSAEEAVEKDVDLLRSLDQQKQAPTPEGALQYETPSAVDDGGDGDATPPPATTPAPPDVKIEVSPAPAAPAKKTPAKKTPAKKTPAKKTP